MSLKWVWPVNRRRWVFYNVEACIIQHEKAIARPRHPLFNALSCCNNVCRWACVFPLGAVCRRLYFICFISFLTCWYVPQMFPPTPPTSSPLNNNHYCNFLLLLLLYYIIVICIVIIIIFIATCPDINRSPFRSIIIIIIILLLFVLLLSSSLLQLVQI